MGRPKGAHGKNCAIDQTEIENLCYGFPGETLEIAAGGEIGDKITLYYCTAVYSCRALN